jgi:hypothetical protein
LDGKPLAFESVQELSGMVIKVVGTLNEMGDVNLTTTSMGTEQKSTVEWPSGALMAEGLRLLELKKGLAEGLKYTTKVFNPTMMQAVETEIRIGAKQNIDLLGRVVALTEVETVMKMPEAGEITSVGYVNDELRVQKSIMPVMGIQMEMVACPKEFALGKNDVFEIIGKMFLASPVPLGDVNSAKSITYYLSPTSETAALAIPSGDNQKVRMNKDGSVIVTVEPVTASTGVRFPYGGTDNAILEATKPTRFLQSDNRQVIELAHQAVGDTKDAAEAIRRIEAFVAEYIENKDLSIGYASAAEVAASRQGDCSEHAVLVAAMCRAVGIPAQVVSGIAYVEDWAGMQNGFGGHAWTQAYVGGKWVGLDAAFKGTGRGGYGPGHIALAVGNGNPEDFLNLVNTLGQFKIDKVIVNKRR